MLNSLFDGWFPIVRTLILGVITYACVVFMLRASGKRTLSKMNAFDLVVTVALGSTLATVLLNKDVSLAQGISALALLIFMQFGVTWLSVRFKWVRNLVTSEPTLLAYEGKLLYPALKRMRISPSEVFAALRAAGYANLGEVRAVVLETEGSCSVLSKISKQENLIFQGLDVP